MSQTISNTAPATVALPPGPPRGPAEKELASRALRGGAVLLAARVAMQAVTWAVTLLVARLLDRSDYGIMTWAVVALGLMELLAEAGLGRALVQKEELAEGDRDEVFSITLMLVVLLYAGLFFGADLVGHWLGDERLGALLRVVGVMAWTLPFRTVAQAVLDREQKLGQQAIVHVISLLLQSSLVLGLAWAGFGYWALAAGALWGRLAETVILCYAAGWWPRLVWPTRSGWGLASFGAYAAGAAFLFYVYSNVDFVVVGKMFGEEALGAYALAFQLMSIPMQRLTAYTNQLAYPVFCRLQNSPGRMRDWYMRLTLLQGLLGAPALVGMALVAQDAFPLVLGEQWRPSVVPFQLLALVGVVMMYAATLPPLFNALGHPSVNFYQTLASCLLLPAAFIVGGWLGGLAGVCVAWLVVCPLIVAGLLWLTSRLTGVGLVEFVWAQWPVAAGVAVMVGCVLAVQSLLQEAGPLPRLVAAIATGATAYSAVMWPVGRGILADAWKAWREGKENAGGD